MKMEAQPLDPCPSQTTSLKDVNSSSTHRKCESKGDSQVNQLDFESWRRRVKSWWRRTGKIGLGLRQSCFAISDASDCRVRLP